MYYYYNYKSDQYLKKAAYNGITDAMMNYGIELLKSDDINFQT